MKEKKDRYPEGIRRGNRLIKKVADSIINYYLSGTDVEVVGLKNLTLAKNLKDQGKKLIITPNHLSHADAPILHRELEKEGVDNIFVMGRRVMDNPATRILSKGVSTILVWPETITPRDEEEEQVKKSVNNAALRSVAGAFREKRAVTVFLEGTRTRTGGLQEPAKRVTTYLVQRKSIILPVGLTGTDKLLPIGKFPKRGKKVSVTFGKPYDPKEVLDNTDKEEKHEEMGKYAMIEIAKILPEEYRGIYGNNI